MNFAFYGILASLIILLGGLVFIIAVLLNRAWQAAGELIYPVRRSPSSSPTDYGLESEAISFRSRDGLTLRGWFCPARGPAKGTLVSIHGYAGDCSPDLIYAPLLTQAGFNVCLFDFRGHGASDGSFTSLVHYERRDLLCALDFLRSRGIEHVGLIGFSMGGAIALATAPLSPMVIAVASDSAFAALNTIVHYAAARRGIPHQAASLMGWIVELLASIRLRANLFSADPIHWVGQIAPRPLLIMHGQADDAIPPSEARRLYQAAREPKDLWIVPGAGHRMIEAVAAEEYGRRLVEFFERAFAPVAP